MKLLKSILLIPFLGLGLLSSCTCSRFFDPEDTSKKDDEEKEPSQEIVVPVNPSDDQQEPEKPNGAYIRFDKLEKDIKVLVPTSNFQSQLTSYRSANLNRNFTVSLKKHVFAIPNPITDTLTYVSSDPEIASVDENGLVTGHQANKSCTITVRSSSGAVATIEVNTYTEENYFVYDNLSTRYYENVTLADGTAGYNRKTFTLPGIKKCIDRDIEELILPTKNPNNEDLRGVYRFAFYQTRKLKKVIIPSGYYEIGESNFLGAYLLETLHLSNTLFTAGFHYGTFVSSKNSLRDVTLDSDNKFMALRYYSNTNNTSGYFIQDHLKSNTKFGSFDTYVYAFGNNVNGEQLLNEEDINTTYQTAKQITSLGCCSLIGLDCLTNLVIPNGVIIIGNAPDVSSRRGFSSACVSHCKNLKTVTLPEYPINGFLISSQNEFSECPNIEKFIVSENHFEYTTKDDSGHETNSLIFLPSDPVRDSFIDREKLNNSERAEELASKNFPIVIRGTKKSTYRDNATYFGNLVEKRKTKLGEAKILATDDYSTISFSGGSFIGVNYDGVLVLPNNTLGVGWGAFYKFGGKGVYIPKTASICNGGQKEGIGNTKTQYINYNGYVNSNGGENGHILTNTAISSTERYYEPVFIDNNIIGLEKMNDDETQTNPLCFFCNKDFIVYLEDKSKFSNYHISLAFVTKQEDMFSYAIIQKSASEVRNL